MEPFKAIQEPDEGYSEHPLYPSGTSGNGASTALTGVQSHSDLPAWLSSQLPSLSISQKTHLAMLILNELPTTVIADIVMNNLNPRLYINFVEYLPPEICLKVFGYLDPVSLIHVAMCCRGWYNLAVDRKLWETLYYLEGWKAIQTEISASEQRMNEGASYAQLHHQRLQSIDDGHVHKKRAISDPILGDDDDFDMVDVAQLPKQEQKDTEMVGSSLFGGPQLGGSGSSIKSSGSMIQHMGNLVMNSPSPMPDRFGTIPSRSAKGKGRATGGSLSSKDASDMIKDLLRLPKSALWIYDARDDRYKINWKYIYTMRRRLESNWNRGRYSNFQLPHPDHLDEGHNECIYSLQYNSEFLVSGSRDKTIRIWDLHTRRLVRPPLKEHTGSVLCLQFDSDPLEDLIVSGSSDSDVILWRFSTGQVLQRLQKAHRESVLNVKFDKRILVTCSKDKTIKIFNRLPLRAGDLGYGEVNVLNPVPVNLRNYGYGSPLDQLPIKPPYTMIGCLEGHGAAVNAVQICGEEIVSASGDRHIKVWDWPNQLCRRTFLGHNKGIACVQYDGRRIVSGSSDNEVKVFDRETGLEVASLRAHQNLVRTVQAGFGDLPYSKEEDRLEAKKVDDAYFAAKEAGRLEDFERQRDRPRNAGSRKPEDITAFGAKLPPGGGGGPYGRIVSGSYDQTIMIWRRDRDGAIDREPNAIVRSQLRQVVSAALVRTQIAQNRAMSSAAAQQQQSSADAAGDSAPRSRHAFGGSNGGNDGMSTSASASRRAGGVYPYGTDNIPAAPSAYNSSTSAQASASRSGNHPPSSRQVETGSVSGASNGSSSSAGGPPAANAIPPHGLLHHVSQQQQTAATQTQPQPQQAQAQAQTHPQSQPQPPTAAALTAAATAAAAAAQQVQQQQQQQQQHHHPHIPQADATNPARIFKLQFDARRIICCSQTSTIVGWDFCNGDPELEEASRFFGTVE
ncbi:putative f-box wd-40 repeat-containing protein [Eutypa lata UCREL1]|uniref:Putative f-box wd-40 repeat-containing protein n=1 Tax=Eutypa lata (strain UCR-EL1) TaxID=1287681 RepID=M7SFY2_EUTLA|nr:putative f-box wd-40 repeat-containing protein [Eutypa lata UCREL1]